MVDSGRAMCDTQKGATAVGMPNEALSRCEPQAKITMELYLRRLSMYDTIAGFLAQIVQDAHIEYEDIMKFSRSTNEVLFLFGQDVLDLCNQIYRRAVRFRSLHGLLDDIPVSEKRSKVVEAESHELEWFSEVLVSLKSRMKPYMNPI